MKSRSYSSEAIVLARKNFGEADRILIVFSKSKGKVSLLAKGIRRPKSKKRGHVEIFNLISFQGISSRGIDVIAEAEVKEDFKSIRRSLKKTSLAYYLCEVIGRTTHDNESNLDVYNLLANFLKRIETESKLRNLRIEFVEKLLVILGFWPNGVKIVNPDQKLLEVVERNISSERVGKILSS